MSQRCQERRHDARQAVNTLTAQARQRGLGTARALAGAPAAPRATARCWTRPARPGRGRRRQAPEAAAGAVQRSARASVRTAGGSAAGAAGGGLRSLRMAQPAQRSVARLVSTPGPCSAVRRSGLTPARSALPHCAAAMPTATGCRLAQCSDRMVRPCPGGLPPAHVPAVCRHAAVASGSRCCVVRRLACPCLSRLAQCRNTATREVRASGRSRGPVATALRRHALILQLTMLRCGGHPTLLQGGRALSCSQTRKWPPLAALRRRDRGYCHWPIPPCSTPGRWAAAAACGARLVRLIPCRAVLAGKEGDHARAQENEAMHRCAPPHAHPPSAAWEPGGDRRHTQARGAAALSRRGAPAPSSCASATP